MAIRPGKWEAAFLQALQVTGTMTGAAKAVEIGRQTVYDYTDAGPQFLDGRRDVESDQVPVICRRKLVEHNPAKVAHC